MAGSFCVALALVLLMILWVTPDEKLMASLRATARWSFVLFWLASTGSALTTLFGSRFRPLAERARTFGLSFASAHLVHVGLVAWMIHHSPQQFLDSPPIFLGIGVFWVYLLAILSIPRISLRLHPRLWRIVRMVGVEYISLVFLTDFAKDPLGGGLVKVLDYLPFLILAIAGPLLRLAAAMKRIRHSLRPAVL
jgi:hypothetical protein